MVARMPEDHWISLDAGEEEGWLMTQPWGPAYEILVNTDAEGGSIEAELVTPYGEPIEDFTRADSVPLTSDGTAQKLTWKSGRSPYELSVEQYGGVCLKLYLTRAKLYSYTYTLPDPDGEAGPAKNQRSLAGRHHSPFRSLGPRLQRAGDRGSPASPSPVQPCRRAGRLRQADAGIDPQQEMKNSKGSNVERRRGAATFLSPIRGG